MRTLTLATVVALSSAALHASTASLPAPIPASGDPQTAFALSTSTSRPAPARWSAPRKCLFAHYTGWLTDGKKFDSSRDTTTSGKPRDPISFPQGSRRVIAGWDVGFEGMRVGGQRRLFIPYQLAYGEAGGHRSSRQKPS